MCFFYKITINFCSRARQTMKLTFRNAFASWYPEIDPRLFLGSGSCGTFWPRCCESLEGGGDTEAQMPGFQDICPKTTHHTALRDSLSFRSKWKRDQFAKTFWSVTLHPQTAIFCFLAKTFGGGVPTKPRTSTYSIHGSLLREIQQKEEPFFPDLRS